MTDHRKGELGPVKGPKTLKPQIAPGAHQKPGRPMPGKHPSSCNKSARPGEIFNQCGKKY